MVGPLPDQCVGFYLLVGLPIGYNVGSSSEVRRKWARVRFIAPAWERGPMQDFQTHVPEVILLQTPTRLRYTIGDSFLVNRALDCKDCRSARSRAGDPAPCRGCQGGRSGD